MSTQPTNPSNAPATASSATGTNVESRIGKEFTVSEVQKNKVRKALFYVWTAIGIVILTAVFGYLLHVLAIPVSMFIWTLVIVFCLRGVVDSLQKRGMNRLGGTIIAYVIMAVVLGAIGFMMFSPMFGLNEQFVSLFTSIPGYVDEIVKWGQGIMAEHSEFFDNDTVKSAMSSLGGSMSTWASGFASDAANAAVGVGTGVANAFMAIGFALVIAFWILLELPQIGAETKRLMSPKFYGQAEFLHMTFTRILGGYIKGTILQCFIIGVACGILFAIIGLPNAPALGVITGTLNIIPIIGPWLGGAAAAITAVMISPLKAVIAILGTIIIQQFVYTFVSPKIMSNSVDIHPALTLIAMMLGSAVGGAMSGMMGSLVGMLLAIPAIAVAKACFVYYFERATGRQIVAADGFVFKGTPAENGADPLYDATSGGPDKIKNSKFRKLLNRAHAEQHHKDAEKKDS